jgi:KDO2-lipid IV(A) lauroyltransferase
LDIQRNKRGYYVVDVQMISENASDTGEQGITKKYIHLLENSIINHPDNWLWSHRRWKFKKEGFQS